MLIPWDELAGVLRLVSYQQDEDTYATIFDLFNRGWFFDRACFIKFSDEVGSPTSFLWERMRRGFDRYAGKLRLGEPAPLLKHVYGISPAAGTQVASLHEHRVASSFGLHKSRHVVTAVCNYGNLSEWASVPRYLHNFDARYFRTIMEAYPDHAIRIYGIGEEPMAIWINRFSQAVEAILYPIEYPTGSLNESINRSESPGS